MTYKVPYVFWLLQLHFHSFSYKKTNILKLKKFI